MPHIICQDYLARANGPAGCSIHCFLYIYCLYSKMAIKSSRQPFITSLGVFFESPSHKILEGWPSR